MRSTPSYPAMLLAAQGVLLGLGGGSAPFVSKYGAGAALGWSDQAVNLLYAVGSLGALLLAGGYLTWERFRPEGRFRREVEGPLSAQPWFAWLAAGLAGLGTGLYAGLLNQLGMRGAGSGTRIATLFAYAVYVPFGLVVLAVGFRALWPTIGRLALYMIFVDLGSQLGTATVRGTEFWMTILGMDSALFLAGVILALVTAGVRKKMP